MTLYQGRIQNESDEWMDALNRSLPVDIRFLPYDIQTNKAWAKELQRIGVLSEKELSELLPALDAILIDFEQGAFDTLPDDEDVHTLVERLLTEKLGPTGAKIHTGRSRNDQVVCDLRLYLKSALKAQIELTRQLLRVLLKRSEQHVDTLFAGTTHLQPAQPVTLGHFLLSLAFALKRDIERLEAAYSHADCCPLGSGALAGSGFPVDRERLAQDLGFSDVLRNSIDAISDRDAVQETVFACAGICTHLSRYAEQFVFWSNPAFGYIRFDDTYSTGSSMMPQKRNPDAMELVRGKAARVIGQCTVLLALTKGVPLSYAKDLQEDKTALFDALDTTEIVLRVFTGALNGATFNEEKLSNSLSGDLLATDLADLLTKTGVPFRLAHERVGKLVSKLESQQKNLKSLTPEELKADFPELSLTELSLSYEQAVLTRSVLGGTAPKEVRRQIQWLSNWLETC